jgi:ribosomal protein L32
MAEVTKKQKKTKGFKPFPARLKKALKDQWYHIQHQVNKYCGYYAQVQQRM